MKKLLVIILILHGIHSIAQDPSSTFHVFWGEETKEEKFSLLGKFLVKNEHGYFISKSILRVGYRGREIVKYNNDLQKVQSLKLRSDKKNRRKLWHEFYFNNKLYSLDVAFKDKSNFFMAQEVDLKSLQPIGEKIELLNIGRFGYTITLPDFDSKISRNEKFLVLYSVNSEISKYKEKMIRISVIDQELNVKWNKEILIGEQGVKESIPLVEVLNDGSVVFLRKSESEKSRISKASGLKYDLYVINDGGDKTTIYPLDAKGKFFIGMDFTIDNSNMIYPTGLYANMYNGNMAGIYFSKINPNSGKLLETIEEFPQNAFSKNSKVQDKEDNTDKKTVLDYLLYVYNHNDNLILVAEGSYNAASMTGASNSSTNFSNTKYSIGNISIVNLTTEGNINWIERVRKSQKTLEDLAYFSSYHIAFHEGNTYLVYNDDKRNIDQLNTNDLEIYSSVDKRKNSVVTLIKIDSRGKKTKEPLFDPNDGDHVIVPKSCENINNNEILLFSHWGNKQHLGRAVFKD